MLRELALGLFSPWVKKALRLSGEVPSSSRYEIIAGEVPAELLNGWKEGIIAKRQRAAFAFLLESTRRGEPRADFVALATAVRTTEIKDPLIIEVGCASGWNSEVLTHLLKRRSRYIGLDYS